MARIRTIKPEFVQSEAVGRLSRDARLLFIQLWTVVDDEGRARAASRMLASLLYPYDDDAPRLIEGWLAELENENCIRRYEVDGSTYLDIPNWLKHQKVDHASKSRLPAFQECSSKPREHSRSLAPDLGPRTLDQDQELRAVAKATRPSRFDEFWKAYPKRAGANPKSPAQKKFDHAVKSGCDPGTIIEAARAYSAECDQLKITNTVSVAQAMTWLNQQRWNDYAQQPAELSGDTEAMMRSRGYEWTGVKWVQSVGGHAA